MSVEKGLYDLLTETYNALDVDARVLAAAGARTVFDRAAELLKINPAITFAEKLDLLHTKGHVGKSERDHLNLLTEAGGAASHRGWRPQPQQLDTVMSVVEAFLHRTFVIDAEVRKLKKEIPKRKRRKKKVRSTKSTG
jgi:hypothetical protein